MSNQKEVIVATEEVVVNDALSVVELEERFEMTAAAAASERCTISQEAAA
ncbi:hypothetical protein SAMN04515674_10645 [Pseudarcicella hirudinis]|uniref:Uncharacterized protein n=1 Tax=Pseudarcicella hirudinis TaxID=1079859 RepID=A0A1I5TIS1_9BACT|nr:hypothetical protein [Pseudarcicella hirudinis]SFP82266.1 hypothetical protein SAMN04515674_10645 [Pseudarcicella hirudinis]